MPYTTQWTQGGLIWKYSGTVSGEELLLSNLDIYGDERFDDLRYQIVDLSAVKNCKVTDKHMQKIAHLDMAAALTNPRIKVAVINGEVLSKVYANHTGVKHWQTKDFDNIEAAQSWVEEA